MKNNFLSRDRSLCRKKLKIFGLITPLHQVAGATTLQENDLSQSITDNGQFSYDILRFEHPRGRRTYVFKLHGLMIGSKQPCKYAMSSLVMTILLHMYWICNTTRPKGEALMFIP
jgi:hypothetical protein